MNNIIIVGLIALVVGVVIGWFISRAKADADTRKAGGIVQAARKEAEDTVRDARLKAQEETFKTRELFEKEIKDRRQELSEIEKRVMQREAILDRKVDLFDRKMEEVTTREARVVDRENELHRLQTEIEDLKRLTQQELQRTAGLSVEDARKLLLSQQEEDVKAEAAAMARRIIDEAKQEAEREAKRTITTVIERCASGHVQTATSCTITLPNEEMKGRIIGREGRNIRAFEAATGINVVIDDTPQAVVLSGFDPVRRELARQTLERLVTDGRINPARIEEEVAKVKEELEGLIHKEGENAVIRLALQKVHPEVTKLLGRLKFRHSFTQNVLDHSIEVAEIEGMMAVELGLSQQIAKRVGLFHDIGKAVDHEIEGSHATIGAALLKKYGEPEEVWQGVACHHHEVEPMTIYGVLASAADAISAARPGARTESMDLYIQRLEKLEALANGFPGVERSYALQAGREIRVFVQPNSISDNDAVQLARDISKKVEKELQYPGQIKVTVVRETRAVEYAK
ncbi:MAG TPA: ribonuclease Y [Verrucomicrobiae bacterium]|nr:ribonuclease Y [Verrucomicrobiae bacterium]